MIWVIILLMAWAFMIARTGPALVIQRPPEPPDNPLEHFSDEDQPPHEKPQTMPAALRSLQFAGFYVLLYLLINGVSLQWATGHAWLTLILTGVALMGDEWRLSLAQERKIIRANLLHSGLGAMYAHILLGVLNAIF